MWVVSVGPQQFLHDLNQKLVDALNGLNIKCKPINAEEFPEEDERSVDYLAFQLQVTKMKVSQKQLEV